MKKQKENKDLKNNANNRKIKGTKERMNKILGIAR